MARSSRYENHVATVHSTQVHPASAGARGTGGAPQDTWGPGLFRSDDERTFRIVREIKRRMTEC